MYTMISLDYSLGSLIPTISYLTMNIHYNSIYRDNLNRLNKLLIDNNYDYKYSLKELIGMIDIFSLTVRGEILYYISSILNHNLYFYNISNGGYNMPIGKIKEDIIEYFGSYNEFKRQFKNKARELKGSGYTFLVKDKDKLRIINMSNEDNPYYYGYKSIMCLDLWEHAYYLDYYNDRDSYINNYFNIIDFNKINIYYEKL